MAANPNVNDFMETWEDMYQICHYKTPSYRAIADESIKNNLEKGQTYHRTYSSDFVVENMGGDGGYNNQAWIDSDETIKINFVKDVSFYIKKLDKFQAQLPLQQEYARKSMNNLFLQMDSDVLAAAYQGAGSVVDDGSLGGTPGNGITLSVGNIMNVFSSAEVALRLANVIYDPTAQFSGDFKLDRQKNMPVAIISAQMYSILLQYLGGKTTELGDNVSVSGFVGKYFGFNLYVSNNLAWTGVLDLTASNPSDGDTITFLDGVSQIIGGSPVAQAITYTFRTTPTAPGDLVVGSTTADTVANAVAAFNAPYVLIPNTATTGYVPFVASALTTTQQKFFVGFSATSPTATSILVQANGQGNVPVDSSLTGGGLFVSAQSKQHNIFGVTKSISVVLQYGPYLEILQSNPAQNSGNSGRVGWDFVTWMTYGIKVFNDQTPMLVDVQVDTTQYTSAPNNTF